MKRIALILAMLVLSGCEIMQEIDKGLFALSDRVTTKDHITGRRSASMSRESQIKQGNDAIAQFIKQMDEKGIKYNEALDQQAYNRLTNIFNKIHSVSHLRDEQWQLLLIPDDSFNAFVTGGTIIVVHSGLEQQLTDDAELAAVIGHEFAHVAANHIGEERGHMISALLTGSESASRSSFSTAFNHEDEEEADEIGILYIALSGYDPYAAHRIWHRMYQQQGDYAEVFVSHPINSERSEQTKHTAEKVLEYYQEGQINPNYAEILKSNHLYTYKENELAAGEGGGIASIFEAAMQGYMKHQMAKIEEDRQENRIAGSQNRREVLQAVNNLLVVTDIDQRSNDQWQLTVQYSGDRNIGDLVFRGALFQDDTLITQFTAQPNGYFAPGGNYHVMAIGEQSVPMDVEVTSYYFEATQVQVLP